MLWQYTIAMTREFIITQAKSTIMVIAKKGTERKKNLDLYGIREQKFMSKV